MEIFQSRWLPVWSGGVSLESPQAAGSDIMASAAESGLIGEQTHAHTQRKTLISTGGSGGAARLAEGGPCVCVCVSLHLGR